MPNSTAEYWDVDGFSLNQLTTNLRSWGGSRESVPALRGSNQVIPYQPGELWVEKVPASREIVLDGWIIGSKQEVRDRWRAFRRLLWRPHEQFKLTRRWRDAAGVLQSGEALGEYVSGLEPVMTAGGTRAEFAVTIKLADPFFYGPAVTIDFAATGSKVVAVKGDYPSRKVTAQFINAQTTSQLKVKRVAGSVVDNVLGYASAVSGATATVDMEMFKAWEVLSGSTTKTSGKVTHTGRVSWLYLPLDTSHIEYARASGSGSAKVIYRPAWN